MARGNPGLAFEQPIYDVEAQIDALLGGSDPARAGNEEEIRALRRQLVSTTRQIYDNLTAWQTVQVARHPERPQTVDYVNLVCDDFMELHGDKHFGDDRAMLTGFAKIGSYKIMLVGHQKGRTFKERSEYFFGCAHPEGYRKALMKMNLAAKFGVPIVCLIDTPGAYPGVGAEERGQSQAIAENMFAMSRIPTPIVCVVIGEGGSGGALGVGVGDRVAILQNAYYSVISPEGCAGILWKSHKFADQAAAALRFTSRDLLQMKIVDEVIPEPLGGAHREHHIMAANLKRFLLKSLRELVALPTTQLLEERYQKFRRIGVFLEANTSPPPPDSCPDLGDEPRDDQDASSREPGGNRGGGSQDGGDQDADGNQDAGNQDAGNEGTNKQGVRGPDTAGGVDGGPAHRIDDSGNGHGDGSNLSGSTTRSA